jgi:signal transduction histidine kinase/ActR/RegA family two-component response regulator
MAAGTAMSGGKQRGMSAWRRYWAELCLLGLIATSGAIILSQHKLFSNDIVAEPGGDLTGFGFGGYSDQVMAGKSITTSNGPLNWTCSLRVGAQNLFCGYEVGLDGFGVTRGKDLSNFDAIEVVVDYQGPPTTVRFHLKNEDPRYSKHGDRSTAKINMAEFSLLPGHNRIVLRPSDFSVAGWWLSQHQLPPELSRIQLDNVVSIEFMTGTFAQPADYSFAVKRIKVVRPAIAPAELYLIILGLLGAALFLYAAHRYRRIRDEARERAALEAQARDALAQAAAAAEQASQAKSDFLANMSHELRTPLNAVLGYAQLLQRAKLDDKQMNAARVIQRSGSHLLSLITDILDLSKIEAGQMELRAEPCDLRAAIVAIHEMVRVPAEQKGLALTCTVADAVPHAVEVDEKRLRQVLLNLLGNAVKFTSSGRVALMVSLLEAGKNDALLRFEVQDSGSGLSPEEVERIFRPFEQAGSVERREAGTGLGLAISRQLVRLMDSDILVQSRVGQGSSFWFEVRLPVVELENQEGAIDVAHVTGYAGARRSVLVVDDGDDNRALLCTMLGDLGFECREAQNGLEALQSAQRSRPDIILMDLKMPGMDGFEATRTIRLIEPLKDVPVIVISANIAEDSVAQCLAAGANAFIGKPVEQCELLRIMARVADIAWVVEAAVDSGNASRAAA